VHSGRYFVQFSGKILPMVTKPCEVKLYTVQYSSRPHRTGPKANNFGTRMLIVCMITPLQNMTCFYGWPWPRNPNASRFYYPYYTTTQQISDSDQKYKRHPTILIPFDLWATKMKSHQFERLHAELKHLFSEHSYTNGAFQRATNSYPRKTH